MTSKLECPFCGHMWDPAPAYDFQRHVGMDDCPLSEHVLTTAQWRMRPSPMVRTYTGSVPTAVCSGPDEITSLKNKIMELEQGLSDSLRYKAYFETEFLLRHGREVTEI